MKRTLALLLIAVLAAACMSYAGPARAEEEAALGDLRVEDTLPLHALALRHGFKMGACISYGQLRDQEYIHLLTREFGSVTPTDEMKAYSLLDQQASKRSEDGMPVMNYQLADEIAAWAQENGLGVRGHVLVWDAYMLDWFFREGYDAAAPYADRETVMERVRWYIRQVIRHFEETYPGVVYCWDVVSEAVAEGEGEYDPEDPRHLRKTRNGGENLFEEHLGDDYVELAFLYAREAVDELGADIKLYYNDYNAYFPEKAGAIRALAESVNGFARDENGQYLRLMDGIGMEGYIGGYGEQAGCLEESRLGLIRSAMEGYAAMGLEVQVTQMAVRNYEQDRAGEHAVYCRELFRVFTGINEGGEGPLKAVTIWCLADRPLEPRGTYAYNLNSPFGGIVDGDLHYKEAYYYVRQALSE